MLKCKSNLDQIAIYVPGKSKLEGIENVIKLSSNENPYGASKGALQAYQDTAKDLALYPDGSFIELKQALAKANNIDPERIMCGAGSDNILELLCAAFAGQRDEVIFSKYSFPVYRMATLTAGATPIEIDYRDDYSHDIDAYIKAITPKTRLIYLPTPDNPTGIYVPKSEMQRLIDALPAECLLVIDEAYFEYVDTDDYKNGLEFANEYPNVAVTRTFSKLFGLAALRVGWGYLPKVAVEALNKIRSPFNVSMPAQKAAIAALQETDWIKNQVQMNNEQRQKMADYYQMVGCKYLPSQGNFICIVHNDALELDNFLKSKGIIVRSMAKNGTPELLRISIGTHEQNLILQSALTEYFT